MEGPCYVSKPLGNGLYRLEDDDGDPIEDGAEFKESQLTRA